MLRRFSSPLLLVILVLFVGSARAQPAPAPSSPDVGVTRDPEAGLPFLTAFTPRDYRGHQQVMSIAEDRAGIMYFGNLDKVLAYDGARWTHIAVPGATFIRALTVDADDTLWIGGVDELGYAKTDATGARVFVSLKDQLPAAARPCGTVWTVVRTPRGVLFQCANWLLRWNGTRFDALALGDSPRWRLTAVGDEFWATDTKHGWHRVHDDGSALTLEKIAQPPNSTGDRAVGAIKRPETNDVLIATDRYTLWRWDGTHFAAFPTEIDQQLREKRPYTMARLADGRIVLCSIQGGVWILDPAGRLLSHLTELQGLPDTTASVAFPARDPGVLWVALARGAARIDVRPWLSWFQPANGLPRSKHFKAARDVRNLLIPGGQAGLQRLIPAQPGSPAHIETDPRARSDVAGVTVAYDSLILTGAAGISERTATGETRPLPQSPAGATSFFALKNHPDLWAALNNDEVSLYRRDAATGEWRTPGPIKGITRVRALVEEADDTWWLGRPAGGALRAKFPAGFEQPPVVETFVEPDTLPPGHGWTRFTQDAQGPLLNCNLGLLRFNPALNRFAPEPAYGPALADGSTYVYASAPDARGGLWVMLRPPNQPEASPEVRLAYGHDGQLTTLHIPNLAALDDPGHLLYEPATDGRPETLWISAHSALVRLDLDRWRASAAAPTAPENFQLRAAVTGSGRRLPLTGEWTLPFADRSLRVEFGAPDLAGDPGALYESTLISSSGTEVQTHSLAERDFTALGSGHYTLRVRARHAGGAWSAPLTREFVVQPPAWRSAWALGGYALLGLLALVVVWKIRTQRWLRRQRELESAVAARTSELAAQNAELHRLRQIEFDEKLAARLAEHKARLEVLRYQLNPHFLFNTLTSICAQIIQSPRTARETVIRLAEFCRLTLHRPGETEDPTLGEEIEMLRAYLDIEQTRLGNLLEYSITTQPELASLRLPPFLLLPVVENAVKYGAATSRDRVRVRLNFQRGPAGNLLIEVANSGEWISPDNRERSVPSLGIGLENLRQRLARYFPGRHEFTTEGADGWVVVRLSLSNH